MKDTSSKIEYISNPFALAYRAAKRLWETNRGWGIFFIVLGVLSSFQSSYNYPASTPSENVSGSTSIAIDPAVALFIGGLVLIFFVLVIVFTIYFTGLFSYVALQSEQGKKVSLGEAMQAVNKKFGILFRASLLAGLKIFGWTLLFIIPGIIASLRYTLLAYLVMDDSEKNNDPSVKVTHDRIKEITAGRLWEVLGISFTSIVPFVGTLFNVAGSAALYRQLKTYTDKKIEKPQIHWLNYLSAAILLAILIAVFFVVALLGYSR